MKRLKIIRMLLSAAILVSLVSCSGYVPHLKSAEKQVGKTFMDGETLVYNSDLYDMTIVGFKGGFKFIYEPQKPLTLQEAADQYALNYVINGSYFEDSRVHAGWLSAFGTHYTPLKDDRQLSHMVVLDTSVGYIDFPGLDLWDSSMTSQTSLEFQAGPLVIDANSVDTLSINTSINGKSSHLRTFLAYTAEDGMKYFIITRQTGPLDKMAEHLLSLPVFKGKTLSLINLDGGSSTALYSRKHPEMNFNVNRPLPILLGIR
ncbi:MAG: phosphodiester glycosidase family protein [Candidatus Marinimicrobia bacterium]|nr:phosphodiester glycosidase family protein [Candidatus Neomarinimicrobiota bacterium]MCF7922398.1 phosphodiester glycosidase family protein [Candidatus Neomarinimicrobiota bacterium]